MTFLLNECQNAFIKHKKLFIITVSFCAHAETIINYYFVVVVAAVILQTTLNCMLK